MQKLVALHRPIIFWEFFIFLSYSFFSDFTYGNLKMRLFSLLDHHKSSLPYPNILYVYIISKFGELSRTWKRQNWIICYVLLVLSNPKK